MEPLSISSFFQYASDAWTTSEVNLLNAVARLCLSVALGCMVGYERKSKGQIAGVGTFALISAGAALAMILSIYIPQEFEGMKNGDPGRIAAQVITGIGFLGAGAIIRMKGTIKGLTTAAGIWLMAMIGMAVGAGLYLVGIATTLLTVGVFIGVTDYEQRVNIGWKNKILKIEIGSIEFDIDEIRQILKCNKLRVVDTFLSRDLDKGCTTISFVALMKSNTDMVKLFNELQSIKNIRTITLDSDFNL